MSALFEARATKERVLHLRMCQIRLRASKFVEVLDFLMGYESYLRKRQISLSSRRYKSIGKHLYVRYVSSIAI
jgi:hypothetical protein